MTIEVHLRSGSVINLGVTTLVITQDATNNTVLVSDGSQPLIETTSQNFDYVRITG